MKFKFLHDIKQKPFYFLLLQGLICMRIFLHVCVVAFDYTEIFVYIRNSMCSVY